MVLSLVLSLVHCSSVPNRHSRWPISVNVPSPWQQWVFNSHLPVNLSGVGHFNSHLPTYLPELGTGLLLTGGKLEVVCWHSV